MGGLAYDTSHVHVIKRKIEMIYSTPYMTPSCTGPPFCTMLNFSVGCNFCYILLDKHHLNQKQFHCKKKKWVSYHLISWYLNSYLFRSCKKFNVPIWNQNMNINTCRKNSTGNLNTCTNFRQVLYFRSTYMKIKITIWIHINVWKSTLCMLTKSKL